MKIVQLCEFLRKHGRGQVVLKEVDSGNEVRLSLSPFVYFAEGDRVRIYRDSDGAITKIDKILAVPGRFGQVDECKVFPYYAVREEVSLAVGLSLPVIYKEVTTEQEFEHLRYLEQFHYLQAKPSWGRQAYLIVKPIVREFLGTPLPEVIGCVVLTSPSLFSGPRNNLLGWNDRTTLTEHIDRVVRIARVIVHPEFRGLGLGAGLVRHAIQYCRERWNVKGKKAWFVETVAEMSRYHPFFERGGLKYVGETKSQEKTFFWDDDPKSLGTEQGPGQVMASVRRFRQKVHTPKPYLIASLLPDDDPYTQTIVRCNATPLVNDIAIVQTRLESPIILQGVTILYRSSSVWDEPEDLNRKWRQSSERVYLEFSLYFKRFSELIDELLCDKLFDFDFNDVRTKLSILRNRISECTSYLEEVDRQLRDSVGGFTAHLKEASALRNELLMQVDKLRRDVEDRLKVLSQLKGDAKVAEERSLLNDFRVRLQKLKDRLDLGGISEKQRWVTDAFGVKPGQETTIVRNLNLEIMPGSIVLIVGPSGSGKSSLLSLLKGELTPHEGKVMPHNLPRLVAALDLDFDPSRPLIDLVGRNAEEAIYLLNHVDLGEAHVYMKRRDQLSHGQRYRAAFAQMLGAGRPVWVADEFCAFLDPVTTLTLCKGIRKLVRQHGITFIAAAAKEDYIIQALEPDIVIRMNAGGRVRPSPQPQHWNWNPDPDLVLKAFEGRPEDLTAPVRHWMHLMGFVESDPEAISGLTWSEDAQKLLAEARKDYRRYLAQLAQHVWSRDWLFHKVWNRARSQMAKDIPMGELGAFRESQVRYRQDFARRLLQGVLV